MKKPARSFPLPQSVPQEQTVEEQVIVEEDNNQNPYPIASQENAMQAEAITSEIYMYIYRDGFDEIGEELKKGKKNLAETLGNMAGNLLSNEMAMAEEDGVDISRDMYIEMQSGVVHQLTEVAAHNGLKDFSNPNEAQAFMGEALAYAFDNVISSPDPVINNESWLAMAQDQLKNGIAQQDHPVTGVRVTEEVVQ
jgi:hypothetical protein